MSTQSKPNYTVPFIIMVALFFLVGFLTVTNAQFQAPLKEAFNLNLTQASLLTFVFFAGFPITGRIASALVDKLGYQKTLAVALAVIAVAMGTFLGSAYLKSFPVFLVGSFIIGGGITILQVVINPYISVLGPKEKAAGRLNLAGALNSFGTVLAPMFVASVVFGGMDKITIDAVYVPYVFLTIAALVLAFGVTRLNLPEVSADDDKEDDKVEGNVWSYSHLVLGIVAIFAYVGVEVGVGNLNLYMKEMGEDMELAGTLVSLYWGGLMVGRFISGTVLQNVDPKKMLIFVSAVSTALVAVPLVVDGMVGVYALVAIGLFHSVMWPCIFTLAIKDLGKLTNKASGLLLMGVFGGAVIPFAQNMWGDKEVLGDSAVPYQMTYVVLLVAEAYILFYALIGSRVNKKVAVEENEAIILDGEEVVKEGNSQTV